jgi:hypothetical protein
MRAEATLVPPFPDPVGVAVRTKLALQSVAWYEESNNDLQSVVDRISALNGPNRVRFARLPFGPENAYDAGLDTWLWLVGEHDEVWDQRQLTLTSSPLSLLRTRVLNAILRLEDIPSR